MLGGGRPTCLYCGLPVELPAGVQQQAERVEARAELARTIADLESELSSEGAAWPRALAIYQFVCMLAWLVTWLALLSRYDRSLTAALLAIASSVFISPYLFWRIASGRRKDKDLRQLAKLSFAQIEAAPQPGGAGWRLACPGCGGAVHAAQIDGLTIRCTQCNSPMLAPAQLVEEGQRHVLQQVIVLRQRLLDESNSSSLVTWAVGLVYGVVVIVGLNVAELGKGDDLAFSMVWPFLLSMSMFLYWLLTCERGDSFWVKVYIGCPLPLAPVIAYALYCVDMFAKATR